ncbi:hypothetical protein HPO96_21305 [Kribbella sandramycini]|uniref:Uncharacterized protein n=1 Tax=Kribbella sandramycini TaxID=60450 RepID=A0A7Y4P0L5_9ACTN|nr:hypothetical protein [Kribbella sandramycini]MBB6566557.1 hypothetical protein [Kribbella sandramycini]NOL42786.1 hypothetical protein [Kribbella sandramycini]
MRGSEVELGTTYLVEVPQVLADDQRLTFGALRGARFPLTVTAIEEAVVEGIRSVLSPTTAVTLTAEQCRELGLPDGVYEIIGNLRKPDGTPITLPRIQTLSVPIGWLLPLSDEPSEGHWDATGSLW